MKFSKKQIVLAATILVGLFIILSLTMSGHQKRDEKGIIEDLKGNRDWFPYCELDVKEVKIVKRQTEKKKDIIYVEIFADNQNAEIQCDLNYKLEYELYNEGWILEKAEPVLKEGWKISEPTQNKVTEDLYEQATFFELNDTMFNTLDIQYEDLGEDIPGIEYKVTFLGEEDKEKFKAEVAGCFHYILRKHGWEYQEDSYLEKAALIPKDGVGEDEAERILRENLDEDVSEIEKKDEFKDYQNQVMTFTYDCYKKYQYLTIIQNYEVSFSFSNASAEWQNIGVTLISENYEWNVVGHEYGLNYEDVSGMRNLTVSIYEVNRTNVKYSYVCSADYWGNRGSRSGEASIDASDYNHITWWIHPDNQLNLRFDVRLDKENGVMISAVKQTNPSVTVIEETKMTQYN